MKNRRKECAGGIGRDEWTGAMDRSQQVREAT